MTNTKSNQQSKYKLPKGWKEVALGQLVKIKGGKRLPKGENLQTEPTSHPYIRVRDMGSRFIDKKALEYVPDVVFEKIMIQINYIQKNVQVLGYA